MSRPIPTITHVRTEPGIFSEYRVAYPNPPRKEYTITAYPLPYAKVVVQARAYGVTYSRLLRAPRVVEDFNNWLAQQPN